MGKPELHGEGQFRFSYGSTADGSYIYYSVSISVPQPIWSKAPEFTP